MYGNSVEKLNVYIRTFQNGSLGQPIMKLVGGQGSLWNRAVVPLSSSKNFHVSKYNDNPGNILWADLNQVMAN